MGLYKLWCVYFLILLITKRFPRPQNRSVTQHRQKQVKQPIVRSVQYPALKGPLIPLQTESPFSKTFWQNSGNLNAEGAIRALKMGLRQRVYKDKELIHHSDRGLQYCCDDYQNILKQEFLLDKCNVKLPFIKELVNNSVGPTISSGPIILAI